MKVYTPEKWRDYELLDSGDGRKLERFGSRTTIRPEPQAIWSPHLSLADWEKEAHLRFVPDGSSAGRWEKLRGANPSENWKISYPLGNRELRFELACTGFKHVGVFPEHAVNWEFLLRELTPQKSPAVLNLFAYTGGASLAARAAGADVIHCDSIRQVVSWARRNMEISGMDGIRWLVEDALGFVKKEVKRNRKYACIIMDPPAWGHGPKGEKWKLEDQADELVRNVIQLLEPTNSMLIFNSYSLGYSPVILEHLIIRHLPSQSRATIETGELCLGQKSGGLLPAGITARLKLQ